MTENLPEDESNDELDFLIDFAVGMILRGSDPDTFLARFADNAPHFAPGLVAQVMGGAQDKRAFLLAIGRLLWNRTPLPDNRFRPRPLPKPERNAPCICGSGRKYKQCCAYTESLPDLFQDMSMLLYVLRHIPLGQYKDLPFSYLDPEELAYVAHTWREEGNARDAVKLLEPFLADPAHLDERAELAFDALIECYNDLGNPRKKTKLIETYLHAPNRTLRSTALHRRISVLSDTGEYAEAWRLFHEAQRLEPDNPHLASLEVLLLQGQGEYEQARQRGRFWIARLSRDRDHDYGDLVGMLRELIETPDELRFKLATHEVPGLDKLRALIERIPAPECHYRLHPQDDSAGPLAPAPKLAALSIDWRKHASVAKPGLTHLRSGAAEWEDVAPGIAWIEKHPLAWHSFDLLDDLMLALEEVGPVGGTDAVLALPLLRHAEALLRLVLRTNQADGMRLEWGWHENRPALRLIANLIHTLLDRRQEAEALPLLEWMVLTLNPNDNHGLREVLSRLYLQRGDAQAAFDLCERYPDDMAAMQHNRALALYRLDRPKDATAALRAAKRDYPEVLRMLLAANPKQPRLSPYGITVGGKDEAWIYRQEHFELWRAHGALDWASSIAGTRKRKSET